MRIYEYMLMARIKILLMMVVFLLPILVLLGVKIVSVNADQECGGVQGHGTDERGVYFDMHGCDRFYIDNSSIIAGKLLSKSDAEIKSDIEKQIADKTGMSVLVEITDDKITDITMCSGDCEDLGSETENGEVVDAGDAKGEIPESEFSQEGITEETVEIEPVAEESAEEEPSVEGVVEEGVEEKAETETDPVAEEPVTETDETDKNPAPEVPAETSANETIN